VYTVITIAVIWRTHFDHYIIIIIMCINYKLYREMTTAMRMCEASVYPMATTGTGVDGS